MKTGQVLFMCCLIENTYLRGMNNLQMQLMHLSSRTITMEHIYSSMI